MKTTANNIIHDLKFRSFVTGFKAESAALWFLCIYIFFEYIRPQGMYRVLDFLPWGQLSILFCLASVFATNSKAIGFGAMDKMFILLSLIVFMSMVFAWNSNVSFKYWSTIASWLIMYYCVVSILTTPNKILLFTIFFLIINFKLSSHGARVFAMRGFSFSSYGLSGSPGWFHNSGEFGLQMVVAFSISLSLLLRLKEYVSEIKRWRVLIVLFPVTAALSVIGSSTRGGQIAFLVVALGLLVKREHLFRTVLYLSVVLSIVFFFLPDAQMERFETMGEDRTSQLRLMHWKNALDVIDKNPMGIGYKNWIPYYDTIYRPEVVQEIHNTVLQAFVELGYMGGGLFLLMLLVSFIMNSRTKSEMEKIGGVDGKSIAAIASGVSFGLLGTFIASLFMSVLYYPMFWLGFAMTSALRHISKNKLKEFKKNL